MKSVSYRKQSKVDNTVKATNIQLKPAGLAGKLTMGQPNDKYEQEADRIADHVMRMPDDSAGSSNWVQKKCKDCEKEEAIQRKSLVSEITPISGSGLQKKEGPIYVQAKEEATLNQPSTSLENRLSGSKNGGSHLPGATRSFMESRIGADFSNVKVHTGSDAVQMSQELGAQAFTHGNHIYFNSGKYEPESSSGKHLLAHELVHTAQQGASIRKKEEKGKNDPREEIIRELDSQLLEINDEKEASNFLTHIVEKNIISKPESDHALNKWKDSWKSSSFYKQKTETGKEKEYGGDIYEFHQSGPGFGSYGNSSNRKYSRLYLVETLRNIIINWRKKGNAKKYPVYIGDLSGLFSYEHHTSRRSVDVLFLTTDGSMALGDFDSNNSKYDRDKTEAFIRTIIDSPPKGYEVEHILFNDQVLIDRLKTKKNSRDVQVLIFDSLKKKGELGNHFDHIHIQLSPISYDFSLSPLTIVGKQNVKLKIWDLADEQPSAEIHNLSGKILKKISLSSYQYGVYTMDLDLGGHSSGVYTLKIITSKQKRAGEKSPIAKILVLR